ncbi:MAG TPA: hypothetical protein VGH99_17655 [Pseudonocardia sp.]|jgi:hypothetical protein
MTGLVVGLLITLALLAPRYGADSRDGRDWTAGRAARAARPVRRTPGDDLRTLAGLPGRIGTAVAGAWLRQERAWGAAWSAYQPWRGDEQPRPTQLRWQRGRDGWRLVGSVAPPTGQLPGDSPDQRPVARD